MRRFAPLARGLTLTLVVTCAGDAPAQELLDPAKLHPLTVPVRDAGVFNWNTKRWVSGPPWPAGPLGSFWMVLGSTGDCSGCSNRAVNYCTAGTSASGCQALLSANGSSSATSPAGFFLNATGVEGNKDGLFFQGTSGRQASSWGNGTSFQCVVPPVKRIGLAPGVGTSGQCDGSATQDVNLVWAAKPAKNPGAGAVVQAQFWYRDPGNISNQTTSLSNAVEWTLCP